MNEYRKATLEDLNCLWEYNIAINPNDLRWIKWKDTYINYNKTGEAVTFTVIVDNIPVGEGTLLFSSECSAINGRTNLADNSTIANINALRIRKKHEGKGYISTLVKLMEDYAAQNGYKCLTIGVDAKETRNLAIYLHWGYNEFVTSEVEDGELVLYYAKNLEQNFPNNCCKDRINHVWKQLDKFSFVGNPNINQNSHKGVDVILCIIII